MGVHGVNSFHLFSLMSTIAVSRISNARFSHTHCWREQRCFAEDGRAGKRTRDRQSTISFLRSTPSTMVLPRRRTVIASSCGSHRFQSILLLAFLLVSLVESFSISSRSRGSIRRTTTTTSLPFQHLQRHYQRFAPSVASSRLHLADNNADAGKEDDDLPFSNNIWEQLAQNFCDIENNPAELANFVQYVSLLRVGIPSAAAAVTAMTIYPTAALSLAALLNDSGVFAVVSQDASQYIQNILTTSGLVFS